MIQKHPYIAATLVATLLAIVVWLCVPKEYTAITKVSDEYKEMDLAIGLTDMQAHIRNLQKSFNKGLNDMNTYSKVLKTEDFARQIARKQVAGKNMTYGTYLGEQDTVKAVLDCINYYYSERHETLTITFTDRDPLVAAQMLDSVTVLLQQMVTEARQAIAKESLASACLVRQKAIDEYQQAQSRLAAYSDSHFDTAIKDEQSRVQLLKRDVQLAYKNLETADEKYVRQQALAQRAALSFAIVTSNSVPVQSNDYFIGYLLSFICIALALVAGYKLYRKKMGSHQLAIQWGDWFSPWTMSVMIWITILGLYYLLDTDLYPITQQFYNCLAIWMPIFCATAFITFNLLSSNKGASLRDPSEDVNKYFFNFFFAISIIITPLYMYKIIEIVTIFSSENLMENIRYLAVNGEGYGFLNHSSIINQALFVVALWGYPRIPMWQVVLLALACILNSLAIMEKGTIFFVFASIIFILFEKKKIRFHSIAVSGAALLLLFYFFNLMRAGEDSQYAKEETLLDFFAMYALSPPVAFSQLLPEVTQQFGTNTFEVVYSYLQRFGVGDYVVKDKLQEFVWVPISTNVYTIFQPFFIDFGYKGVAFFSAVYGVLAGLLYHLFKARNTIGCCLYTYMVYVLILQFYQDNIFLSLAFVIEFSVFIILSTQKTIGFSYQVNHGGHACR